MQMDRPVAEPDIVIIEPGEWPLRARSGQSGAAFERDHREFCGYDPSLTIRRQRPVTGPYREMIAIGNPGSLRFALVVLSC
jgi:hypothetical protein